MLQRGVLRMHQEPGPKRRTRRVIAPGSLPRRDEGLRRCLLDLVRRGTGRKDAGNHAVHVAHIPLHDCLKRHRRLRPKILRELPVVHALLPLALPTARTGPLSRKRLVRQDLALRVPVLVLGAGRLTDESIAECAGKGAVTCKCSTRYQARPRLNCIEAMDSLDRGNKTNHVWPVS